MYAQADKTKENKSESVKNTVNQKQSDAEAAFQLVDNRPETAAQRKLQEMLNNSVDGEGRNTTIQRQLRTTFKSHGEKITEITGKGRPQWSVAAKNKKRPGAGQSRGHIIEWSIRLRAFINRAKSMQKSELLKLIDSRGGSDKTINSDLHTYLKHLYNDLDNLSINDTQMDSDAGGEANDLTQKLGNEKDSKKREEYLRRIFYLSFNPVEGGDLEQLPKYLDDFADAWNLDRKELEKWDHKGKNGDPMDVDVQTDPMMDEKEGGEEATEEDDGLYKVFGDGIQEHSEKWVKEAFEENYDSYNNLEELGGMLMDSYGNVSPEMKEIYLKYLDGIKSRLQESPAVREAYETEIATIENFLLDRQ